MTWEEKLIARILMFICKMITPQRLQEELRSLSNSITTAKDEVRQ